MKSKLIWSITIASALMIAGLALAQTGTPTPSKAAPPSGTPGVGTGQENKGLNTAETKAADQAKPELEAVRTRAKTMPAKQVAATEPKIDAEIKNVNGEAAKEGSNVADRLAIQFGMTPGALEAEKTKFNAGLGELMIAHLLFSNEKTTSTITLDDLFTLHQEGVGWGQIARGMGLNVGDLVIAAKSEGRVATGMTKPGTKMRMIRLEGDQGAMASKGVSNTMEHGKSTTSPGHDAGGGTPAGYGK
jgi:hypothetical protein